MSFGARMVKMEAPDWLAHTRLKFVQIKRSPAEKLPVFENFYFSKGMLNGLFILDNLRCLT